MDIHSLRSFVLFAQLGSLSKVATIQCRTNAAISAQMKKLSEAYNIELFEKSGRKLTLSNVGESFLDVAKCILSLHDNVVEDIKNNDLVITIKIGVPSDYVGSYLLELLKYLTSSLKKIKFDLVILPSKNLYELWKKNELDITIYSAEHASSEGTTVSEVQGYWVANQNYNVPQSSPLNIVLFDDSCLFHKKAVAGLINNNFDFNIHSTTSDSRTLCNLVESFDLLSAMSKISMNKSMKIVHDDALPKLPLVYIKLLLSEKLKEIDIISLVNVLKPMTSN
ncbi:MAG: LysR family transcriptional regulator [Saccharospirillaceae bacterium]|nr:LysR family transcriptional regulator [Colwellia sp.]NRB77312.1 LysR family transcriptional regulator [Saccharospirillaceae bacterium]